MDKDKTTDMEGSNPNVERLTDLLEELSNFDVSEVGEDYLVGLIECGYDTGFVLEKARDCLRLLLVIERDLSLYGKLSLK